MIVVGNQRTARTPSLRHAVYTITRYGPIQDVAHFRVREIDPSEHGLTQIYIHECDSAEVSIRKTRTIRVHVRQIGPGNAAASDRLC